MKLLLVGLGQCGSRIADQFARIGKKAHTERGIDFIGDVYAVDSDATTLAELEFVKTDEDHRIIVGSSKVDGAGLGRVNELGYEIAKEENGRIISLLRRSPDFSDTDAFVLIASTSGGTGSGGVSVLAKSLKEQYPDKPVYSLAVLPFEREELAERRADYNTATCLKSLYIVADAVVLIDNQRYLKRDPAVQTSIDLVNTSISNSFYNLLCASEERRPKYIGSNMVRTGDIIRTLSGWTAIGRGKVPTRGPIGVAQQERTAATERGVHAMSEAINDISVDCSPADARRVLCLMTAPSPMINIQMFKEIGDSLRRTSRDAMIMSGDYPRDERTLEIVIILSEIVNLPRVVGYVDRAVDYIIAQKRRKGIKNMPRTSDEIIAELPLLF